MRLVSDELDPAIWRAKAEWCRHLMGVLPDEAIVATLRILTEEYELKAEGLKDRRSRRSATADANLAARVDRPGFDDS